MSLEPATGGAEHVVLTIDQGVEMGRPSRLDVTADRQGSRVVVRVEGRAAEVRTGKIKV